MPAGSGRFLFRGADFSGAPTRQSGAGELAALGKSLIRFRRAKPRPEAPRAHTSPGGGGGRGDLNVRILKGHRRSDPGPSERLHQGRIRKDTRPDPVKQPQGRRAESVFATREHLKIVAFIADLS